MKNLGKLSLAALLVSAACGASAGELYSGDKGTMSLSGDVEYDINYVSKNQDNNGESDKDTANQDGRILFEFAGERVLDNGYYAQVVTQMLGKSDGDSTKLDDAYIKFGMQDTWDVTVGRKEGIDMMPLDDTFVADGNDYQLEYSRDRTNNGAIILHGYVGGLTAEMTVLAAEDTKAGAKDYIAGTNIAGGHDGIVMDITEDSSNPIWVRPVLSYTGGAFTVAAGMETAINVEDAPVGYGAKISYAGDTMSFNLSVASTSYDHKYASKVETDSVTYVGAGETVDVKTTTTNANIHFGKFMVGGFYTKFDDDGSTSRIGLTDYTSSEVYTSYQFTNVLGMDNFNLIPAAYYEVTDFDGDTSDYDQVGLRLRIKYYF